MRTSFQQAGQSPAAPRQRGATLIEVLVTVAVTSVGLLGMAGLMIAAARFNQAAYVQTQVNLIAQTLIESMHVNVPAVRSGAYDGRYDGSTTPDPACTVRGCSAAERAAYDRARFDHVLSRTVPNATGSLTCTNSVGQPADAVYAGLCRLQVGWSEHGASSGAGGGGEPTSDTQSQVWIFQP